MEGKWTIYSGPQPDNHFSKPVLTPFSMQISEKRNTPSPNSEEGKQRLSGWDNIIWKMKKKPNALPPNSPTPFHPEGMNPKVCKGKRASTILLFIRFVGGGAWVCLPPPPPCKKELNPTSGRCRERLPRKFSGQEGVTASWRGSQGREDGRKNGEGPRRRAPSRSLNVGAEASEDGGLLGCRAPQEAGGSSLRGGSAPPLPRASPALASPNAPAVFSCPVLSGD